MPGWQVSAKISDSLYILSETKENKLVHAPLYIHSFPFFRPKRLSESEKFNLRFTNPDFIATTADKLRYYRYRKSLRQSEVAKYAGIDESTYVGYENEEREYYPLDKLAKISELLNVDLKALLDDYNCFLYEGQGRQIRAFRKSMKMTQVEFGKRYGVHGGTVKKWESGKIRLLKSTWERIFVSGRGTRKTGD